MENKIHRTLDKLSCQNPFKDELCPPSVPRFPDQPVKRGPPIQQQLNEVQERISNLQYNFLPTTFFNLQKMRSLRSLLMTAQEIVAESLPIRCLEATFLAIQQTQHLQELDRFPLAFKSVVRGKSYRHIVLVIRVFDSKTLTTRFGSLGLSRKSTLMGKPLQYRSLVELIEEYARRYAEIGHELASIKLGLCFDHDAMGGRLIPMWRFLSLPVPKLVQIGTPPSSANTAGKMMRDDGLLPCGSSAVGAVGASPLSPFSAPYLCTIQHDIRFVQVVENFSSLLDDMSREYLTLPASVSGLKLRSGGTPTSSSSPCDSPLFPFQQRPISNANRITEYADEDEATDDEENQYRVQAVACNVSPFSANKGENENESRNARAQKLLDRRPLAPPQRKQEDSAQGRPTAAGKRAPSSTGVGAKRESRNIIVSGSESGGMSDENVNTIGEQAPKMSKLQNKLHGNIEAGRTKLTEC